MSQVRSRDDTHRGYCPGLTRLSRDGTFAASRRVVPTPCHDGAVSMAEPAMTPALRISSRPARQRLDERGDRAPRSLRAPAARRALRRDRALACALRRARPVAHRVAGLRPDLARRPAVARDRNLRLYTHAAPVMELLYEQIINTQSMVVLTDSRGTIIHSIGDDDFLAARVEGRAAARRQLVGGGATAPTAWARR